MPTSPPPTIVGDVVTWPRDGVVMVVIIVILFAVAALIVKAAGGPIASPDVAEERSVVKVVDATNPEYAAQNGQLTTSTVESPAQDSVDLPSG